MAIKGKQTVLKSKKAKDAKSSAKRAKTGGRNKSRVTLAKQVEIAERQHLVLECVKMGSLSYRQIADFCQKKGFRSSAATVTNDLKAVLERQRKETDLSAQDWVQIELGTLSELQQTFYIEAKQNKDPESAGVVLRIIRERDRYTNASKTSQSQAAAAESLADFLGIKPEELPNGDGDSL